MSTSGDQDTHDLDRLRVSLHPADRIEQLPKERGTNTDPYETTLTGMVDDHYVLSLPTLTVVTHIHHQLAYNLPPS